MKYKVMHLINETYQVVEYENGVIGDSVFQGSLSDCNAWLQLHDNNYLF